MIRFIFNPFHPCLQFSHAIGNSYLDVTSNICWLENGLLLELICIMQNRKIVLIYQYTNLDYAKTRTIEFDPQFKPTIR